MNKLIPSLALLVLGLPLGAAVEPVSLAADSPMPSLPASLQVDAVTDGKVMMVIDIDANGHPTDSLVLAFSEPRLAKVCTNSVGSWRFHPARVDGVAVPSQTEVTVNFAANGVVVTSNLADEMFLRTVRGSADVLTMRTCDTAHLDHAPARIHGGAPAYAAAALRAGVRGAVTVHFYIDENGAVRMPAVDSSAHPYLAQQAVAALSAWQFEPPTSGRKPVLVAAEEKFSFGAN
ncbi:MAG TPA: TonB family protein [Candidatus Didemnitutus sp.]|nr:TonB family protein [Candidatus Didemnitutus sp.]